MKEQVLNASDRAALQGLIPLAGALGAGTIFALFFGGRRRGSGVAVFELFAIVAVLVAAGTTAYFAIALLHLNEPIGDHELTQTATPLLVATMLLIIVSAFARLPASWERIFTVFPLAITGVIVAAYLSSSAWTARPGDAPLVAGLILGVGGLLALVARGADHFDGRSHRKAARRRFTRLSSAGYLTAEKEFLLALPAEDSSASPQVTCWTRKGNTYLDAPSCWRLRDEAEARWQRLSDDKARAPVGPVVLMAVEVSRYVPWLRETRSLRLFISEPASGGEPRLHEIDANDDYLFDVTELGLI
jgi:hypothetical protein